jgi:hypothetical protein
MKLCLHSPIRLHAVEFNKAQDTSPRRGDKFTFTFHGYDEKSVKNFTLET